MGVVLPPVLEIMVSSNTGHGAQTVLLRPLINIGTVFSTTPPPIGSDATSVSHPSDKSVPILMLLFKGLIATFPILDTHCTLFCVHNLKQCLTLL